MPQSLHEPKDWLGDTTPTTGDRSSVKKYSPMGQTRVHEYLRDTKYAYCNSCNN